MRIEFIIALILIIHCASERSLIASKYAAAVDDIIVHCSTPLVSISDTYTKYDIGFL